MQQQQRQESRAVRNPITGEWHGGRERLEALGIPYIVLKNYDKPRRGKRWDNDPKVDVTPNRLHIHTSEGHLGGLLYTSSMRRYIREPKDDPKPTRNYAERHWWAGEDAERELRATFPPALVDIVLSVRRDGRSWEDALKDTGYTHRDVNPVMRRMARQRIKVIQAQYSPAA